MQFSVSRPRLIGFATEIVNFWSLPFSISGDTWSSAAVLALGRASIIVHGTLFDAGLARFWIDKAEAQPAAEAAEP